MDNTTSAKKVWTTEEIKVKCPNYKGPVEKFNPNFKRKGPKPQNQQSINVPTSSTIPPPTRDTSKMKPTPQKNTPILKDSIYGEDVVQE